MITRRTAAGGLIAAGASLLLPNMALSQPQKPYYWRQLGDNPYVYGRLPDEGIRMALPDLPMTDDDRNFFLAQYTAGKMFDDELLYGQKIDAMKFGRGETYHDVICMLAAHQRKVKTIFRNKRKGVMACILPRCHNWSVTLWEEGQPPCIPPSQLPSS